MPLPTRPLYHPSKRFQVEYFTKYVHYELLRVEKLLGEIKDLKLAKDKATAKYEELQTDYDSLLDRVIPQPSLSRESTREGAPSIASSLTLNEEDGAEPKDILV
jgi:uncharacterized protein YlbG (UPF0298 family)